MLLRGPSSCCAAAAAARLPSPSSSRAARRARSASLAPLALARPSSLPSSARSSSSKLRAISKPTADAAAAAPVISIDNGADSSATVVRVAGFNRPGLLTAMTAAFRDLGLDVKKVREGERGSRFVPFVGSLSSSPSAIVLSPDLKTFHLSNTRPLSRPRSDLPAMQSTTRSTSRW